jgi:hypothetical protein
MKSIIEVEHAGNVIQIIEIALDKCQISARVDAAGAG